MDKIGRAVADGPFLKVSHCGLSKMQSQLDVRGCIPLAASKRWLASEGSVAGQRVGTV